jgi:uncharacterized protein YndB with AHSA1/START domain
MVKPQVSDKSVIDKTGKGWEEWFTLLDNDNCTKLDHKGIVAILRDKYFVGDWWQQMIAVSYEQARGLRQVHEKQDGFQISKNKTINCEISVLFKAWEDEQLRQQWLEAGAFVVRKVTPNKSMRITWEDGTSWLDVMFYQRNEKTQVSINHSKLPTADAAEKMKAFWENQLLRLEKFIMQTYS